MNKPATFFASILFFTSTVVLTGCIAPVITLMEAENLGEFKLTQLDCGEFFLVAREHTGMTEHVGSYYYRNVSFSLVTASAETRIDYLISGGGLSSADDPYYFLEPAKATGIEQEKFIDSRPVRDTSVGWQLQYVRVYVSPDFLLRVNIH